MAKVLISLLVVLCSFASLGHALPSLRFFNNNVIRLDSHLFSNATCKEQKTYYINNRVETNWVTAHLMCESFGFELISFNNLPEMNGFLDYLQKQEMRFSFWLGATNINTYKTTSEYTPEKHGFYWLSNGQNINYKVKWFAGEPNNPSTEQCLHAGFRNNVIGLNDFPCNRQDYFICQLDDCPHF
ncbi:unnamed protein product [Diamesa serratosioi]